VHRDVKPANILLADGHAVVADFGIARAVHQARERAAPDAAPSAPCPADRGAVTLTAAGTSPGTPAYMAPEQVRGGPGVDHRADLYALGVVAYEALAGAHPFSARAPEAFVAAHLEEAPAPLGARRPDVPPALAALVLQLLAKDPASRPRSAEDVLRSLGAVAASLSDAPERTARELARPARVRPTKRAGGPVLAALTVLLVLSALGGYRLRNQTAAARLGAGSGRGAAATDTLAGLPVENQGGSATERGTSDPEAYEMYLKGHYYFLLRGAQNLHRAIGYFERAIARDPGFARAHAGLAQAYNVLPIYAPVATDSIVARMESSARRALALDSTLADAHLAMAAVLEVQLRFRDLLPHYHAAAALDPASATAHHWYGMHLLMRGRHDDALAELHRSTQLDPLGISAASGVALAYLFARRFPEALDAGRHAIALDSTQMVAILTMGKVQVFAGQPDSAVRTLERGLRLHPRDTRLLADLVFAYAAEGRWDEAARIRARLHRQDVALLDGTEPAFADLVFGDPEPLVRILSSAEGERRYLMGGGVLGCNPVLDPLWADVRFRTAMRKLTIEPCPLARRWPLPPNPGG